MQLYDNVLTTERTFCLCYKCWLEKKNTHTVFLSCDMLFYLFAKHTLTNTNNGFDDLTVQFNWYGYRETIIVCLMPFDTFFWCIYLVRLLCLSVLLCQSVSILSFSRVRWVMQLMWNTDTSIRCVFFRILSKTFDVCSLCWCEWVCRYLDISPMLTTRHVDNRLAINLLHQLLR